MPSIESSLKFESEVGPGKIRLVTSGEFARAYNHSAWLFYCCVSKYKVIRKYSKARGEEVYFLGFPAAKLLELAAFDRFVRLRKVRMEIAEADGVKPFVVMTDAQMAQLAKAERPTKADLGRIEGFGEARVAKYGERLLATAGEGETSGQGNGGASRPGEPEGLAFGSPGTARPTMPDCPTMAGPGGGEVEG